MPEPPPVIRETTARNFIKDRTGMRVREDAVDAFVNHFTDVAEEVASRAAELAEEEERTTILKRHVETAFSEIETVPRGPDAIHTAIDTVSNQGLSQLIQLLRVDLATPPGTPP